jgi:multiple sugar transport system permease protein
MWHYLLNPETGLVSFLPALLSFPRPPYLLTADFAFFSVIATEVWRKAPLAAFLLLPGLLAVPADQWDNARLDGLSIVGQMRYVIVPRSRLLLLTLALLLVGDALGTCESIFFLTGGGPGSRTMTPALYSYLRAVQARNWSGGGTAGWFIVATMLLVGLCYLVLARRWKTER